MPDRSFARNQKSLLVLVVLAFSLGILVLFTSRLGFLPIDWKNYMLAASRVLEGFSPYGTVEFFGPPWLAIALGPLARLPPAMSPVIWVIAAIAAAFLSSALWNRFYEYPPTSSGRLLLSVISAVSPVALYVYLTGQITAVVLLALIWLVASGGDRLKPTRLVSIVAASLVVTSKPHLVAFPLLLVVMDRIRDGKWEVPVTFAATMATVTIGTFIIWPSWLGEWFAAIAGGRYYGGPGLSAASYYGLRDAGIPELFLILPSAYTYLHWRRNGLTATTISLALASGLMLTPYVRTYDYLMLWPAATTASGLWVARGRHLLSGVTLAAILLLPLTDFALLLPVLLIGLLLAGTSLSVGVAKSRARASPMEALG